MDNTNVFSYISSVHKSKLEEEDLHIQPNEETLLLGNYIQLLEAIQKNAQVIDNHYKTGDLFRDFRLETLFKMIDPKIFNFIHFVTMSRRERKVLFSSPNIKRYLRGEIFMLDTYDATNKDSHKNFVRRVFLSIELIFLQVRGALTNPLSFMITDLITKHSGGSVTLLKTLNHIGVAYSFDTYKRLR